MVIGDYIIILCDGCFQVEVVVKDIDVLWIVCEMLGSDLVFSFFYFDWIFGVLMMEVDNVILINEFGNIVVN